MNSGYTLWGTLTSIQHNPSRIYPPEALKNAISHYMKMITQKQRKEKLEKITKINGERK